MKETKLIAHRGASFKYLENTKLAFISAGKDANVWGIECDVQTTFDNFFVIYHDRSLKRLNGNKSHINKTPLFILKRYKLFDKRDKLFDKGYSICKFTTYLKICKKYKKFAVIEIKYSLQKEQLDKLIKIIKKRKMLKRVVFISFNAKMLIYLKQNLPYVDMQLLVKNPILKKMNFCVKHSLSIALHHALLKPDIVQIFHEQNLKVGVWTVNNLQQIKKYKQMGVDYITSDYSFDLKTL